MYDISEKRNAIREIQKQLYTVSDEHVSISGIYDDGTRISVVNFQNKNNLTPSGVVDNDTLNILFKEYKKTALELPKNIDFPLTPGNYGEHIRKINKKIAALLDYYGVHHKLRSSPNYSEETKFCVEKIRQIFKMEQSPNIDKALYTRIMNDFENIPNYEN